MARKRVLSSHLLLPQRLHQGGCFVLGTREVAMQKGYVGVNDPSG